MGRHQPGRQEKPKYSRCRLVATEIKKDKWEDLLRPTPPLEAEKMLFSLWASAPGVRMDFGDEARAYLHGMARKMAHVELSHEDRRAIVIAAEGDARRPRCRPTFGVGVRSRKG